MAFQIKNGVLLKYIDGKSCEDNIVILEEVTKIGERAFYECKSLISVVIPETVIKVGKEAFAWCGRIRKVVISDGVREIDNHAFGYCRILVSAVIPQSVIKIEERAFTTGARLIFSQNDIKVSVELLEDWGCKAEEIRLAKFFHGRTEENFAEIKKAAYKIPLALMMTLANSEEETDFKAYTKKNITLC